MFIGILFRDARLIPFEDVVAQMDAPAVVTENDIAQTLSAGLVRTVLSKDLTSMPSSE